MQNSSKSWLQAVLRPMLVGFFTLIFALGVTGCTHSDANVLIDLVSLAGQQSPKNLIQLQEVSPPALLEDLRSSLSPYQPQLKIITPAPNAIVDSTTIAVTFELQDYPLFKDPDFGMGPHIHLFLDDRSYTAIYSTAEPLILENLEPGTHTLRAFASRPWHESFKNEGAYAQVTFHVFTETGNNAPDPTLPLLTYSRPQGTYGAEPIMLDFYLTNAPLHFLASADPEDEIPDWRIRATINGESFLIDRWEPLYLTGFKEGLNWVKLEFLGEDGEPIVNGFNTTARLIEYYPGGTDGLSRIVRGEVDREAALAIVLPPSPEESELGEPNPELDIPESSVPESNLLETTLEPDEPDTEESSGEFLTESQNPSPSFDQDTETIVVPEGITPEQLQATPVSPDVDNLGNVTARDMTDTDMTGSDMAESETIENTSANTSANTSKPDEIPEENAI